MPAEAGPFRVRRAVPDGLVEPDARRRTSDPPKIAAVGLLRNAPPSPCQPVWRVRYHMPHRRRPIPKISNVAVSCGADELLGRRDDRVERSRRAPAPRSSDRRTRGSTGRRSARRRRRSCSSAAWPDRCRTAHRAGSSRPRGQSSLDGQRRDDGHTRHRCSGDESADTFSHVDNPSVHDGCVSIRTVADLRTPEPPPGSGGEWSTGDVAEAGDGDQAERAHDGGGRTDEHEHGTTRELGEGKRNKGNAANM